MGKINLHSVLPFITIFITIVSSDRAAAETSYNIISSLSPVHLKHWQIAPDPGPGNNLQTPPDSMWRSFGPSLDYNKYTEGNWLLRTVIYIEDSAASKIIFGLFPVRFVTAYEIYWDGIKIAQNGVVGINNTFEKAGIFNFNQPLFSYLTAQGKHTVTLRISNHNNYSSWKWFYGDFVIGKYDSVLKSGFRSGYHPFFLSGILFIAFLFNLFLYITRSRKTEHLLFSIICLLVTLDFVITQAPLIFDFPTTYIHFENYFYQLNTLSFTILFPVFFIYTFLLSKKFIGIILTANIIIFLFFTDIWNIFAVLSLSVLIISSAVALWALKLKREGSLIISIGLILSWIAYYFNFAFEGLAAVMVICTSFSIARQFAGKEYAEHEAQLKSAHLENELLKKNINPHFVLNTLTSIIVWLRKDSNSAIKLIEALAEEFRMINQISALKLIPISREIELCRAHLKIMSYRKGADYKIETLNIDEQDTVPPMIFHTLVENGLTHGYGNKTAGTFILQMIKNPDCVKYILTNDGDYNPGEFKGSTGFGAKYIKSRLEESYPDRWEFISNKSDMGWESVIEIRNN